MPSALLIHGVPIECLHQAAVSYHVPVTILVAIVEAEGAAPGSAHKNRNGTIDYGVMQINSLWLPKIIPFGYSQTVIQYDPCASVAVGAWILSQRMAEKQAYWQSIADYHSYSLRENEVYQKKLIANYKIIMDTMKDDTPIF